MIYNKNMLLKEIRIRNLGAFASKSEWIKLGGQMATIIGENGTGKSTILFAINLLLDKKTRRKGVSTNWIPKSDTTPTIEYVFDARKFREINVALPIEENNQIHITIELQLNEDKTRYFPTIIIGKDEKIKYSYIHSLPFDRHIEIIHIKPNIENNIADWIENVFDGKTLIQIKDIINATNEKISEIQEIIDFKDNINDYLKNIIKNNFDITVEANIQLTKIGKSLNIFHTKNNERVVTHGDGYKKILSILSNIKRANDNKIKLIIIDELENHFFYIYQSRIIDYLCKLVMNKEKTNTFSQIIIITHSPNIVKIIPKASITKLRNNYAPYHFMCNEDIEDKYYFYQKELASAIFYDKILIVEGHSEKMFYEYLIKHNKYLKELCTTSEIFVLNNQGCYFKEILSLFKSLSSKVVVLTDNDIWGSPNHEYKGVKRIWTLLPIEKQKKYKNVKFDVNNDDEENNELLKEIIRDGEDYKIFTQEREEYGCKDANKKSITFEYSLINEGLIEDDNLIKKLKESKLKLLSTNMYEISKKVNKEIIQNSKYLFEWVGVFNDE